MAESNVQLARRGYAAILTGDVDAVEELLDAGVVWHGGDPAAGAACHNRNQALAVMRRARARGGIGELIDVIDAGDRVIVIMRPPSPDGQPANPIANLSTFRDGKVVEMVHYPDPDDAIAAADAQRG